MFGAVEELEGFFDPVCFGQLVSHAGDFDVGDLLEAIASIGLGVDLGLLAIDVGGAGDEDVGVFFCDGQDGSGRDEEFGSPAGAVLFGGEHFAVVAASADVDAAFEAIREAHSEHGGDASAAGETGDKDAGLVDGVEFWDVESGVECEAEADEGWAVVAGLIGAGADELMTIGEFGPVGGDVAGGTRADPDEQAEGFLAGV